MNLPRLSRLPKNKRFDYTPRYFSEIKDRQEARRYALGKKTSSQSSRHDLIRSAFKNRSYKEPKTAKFRWLIIGLFCMLLLSFAIESWVPMYFCAGAYLIVRITQKIANKKST